MNDTMPSIRYEFDTRPDFGETLDVAPGVKWLRLPLPFMLGHINVWLLEDGDGWAVVDTGIHNKATREVWREVFVSVFEGRPVTRVFATHLHPDHVGCAGWLAERFDVDLWMSREEYLLCRILVADTGKPAPEEGIEFYTAAGFTPDALERYIDRFGTFGLMVAPLPQAYRRLHDGQTGMIGGHEWRTIVGRGHSPEHACLYCPELNVVISGDQILPTISSNVSVWPTEPGANPLAHWFESLESLKHSLPEDVLVLPAHGKPFRGAHIRLDELIREHQTGLDNLRELCREPRRALDVFPALFKSRITDTNLIMATGESISHLNYLHYGGELSVHSDADGVKWYQIRE